MSVVNCSEVINCKDTTKRKRWKYFNPYNDLQTNNKYLTNQATWRLKIARKLTDSSFINPCLSKEAIAKIALRISLQYLLELFIKFKKKLSHIIYQKSIAFMKKGKRLANDLIVFCFRTCNSYKCSWISLGKQRNWNSKSILLRYKSYQW